MLAAVGGDLNATISVDKIFKSTHVATEHASSYGAAMQAATISGLCPEPIVGNFELTPLSLGKLTEDTLRTQHDLMLCPQASKP